MVSSTRSGAGLHGEGAGLHGDGALSLRFNCARLSLDAIQFEQQLRLVTQLSPTSASGQHDSDSSRLILGTKL